MLPGLLKNWYVFFSVRFCHRQADYPQLFNYRFGLKNAVEICRNQTTKNAYIRTLLSNSCQMTHFKFWVRGACLSDRCFNSRQIKCKQRSESGCPSARHER